MHSTRIAGAEFKRLLSDRRIRLATIVIAIVPLLYGALYLWAFWDPYQNMSDLPVALVNLDKPATADGEAINAGKDLTDELIDDASFGWKEVSAQQAARGVKDGTYYMSLTIPANFSADLATANSDKPVKAKLQVVVHESANMLATQIGDKAFDVIRAATSANASKSYLDHIFIGFSDTKKQLSDAALGAKDLASGIKDAKTGADALADGAATASSGGTKLASSLTQLAEGATSLDSGATDLKSGIGSLNTGLSSAKSGASDLYAGTKDLTSGSSRLISGMTSITAGSAQAVDAADQVSTGAAAVDAGVNQAAASFTTAATTASQIHTGAAAVLALLKQYASTNASAATDPTFQTALGAASQTDSGAAALVAGLQAGAPEFTELVSGADQLSAGAAALSTGVSTLDTYLAAAQDGMTTLSSGASALKTGAAALSSGIATAKSGSALLADGATDLKSGTSLLAKNEWLAADGASTLNAGLGQLADGTSDLASGLTPAVSGSDELSDGLTASLDDVPDYGTSVREANTSMMSDPVDLGTDRLDPVPNYGTGFAPYFIPLALWVGALMAFFIAVPLPAKAVAEERNPITVALGGFWPGALIGAAQAVIMLLVLHFALGLEPRSTLALYGFTVLSAIVFISISQFLSASFGAVGKVLSIVLLMLQLTSAAGTFPIEWVPKFFQVINPFLPMTYVVGGLRQAISGGDWGVLGQNVLMLAIFGLAALALTSITAIRARSWDPERLKPSLEV